MPGALRPFCLGNGVRVRWEVVAEDELADPRAFGDAADLGDVGMQPGHPGQFGVVGAVPLEVTQVGDLVDEDVGPPGQGDQGVVHAGVAGECDGAVRCVEPVGQRRNRPAVRHGHGGDLDDPVVEDDDRNVGDVLFWRGHGDVGGPG
jgi:hypothetical protein